MDRGKISFLFINFILLFVLIFFIFTVFDLKGLAFVFELGILFIMIFLVVFSIFVIYQNRRFGWVLLGFVLLLIILNTFFILLLKGKFEAAQLTTLAFSFIGLLMVLFNIIEKAKEQINIETNIETGAHEEIKEVQEKETKLEKKFSPGKFVASKNANKFHSPKCDWAKRINKTNRMWFNSREEAESKGFRADTCVA